MRCVRPPHVHVLLLSLLAAGAACAPDPLADPRDRAGGVLAGAVDDKTDHPTAVGVENARAGDADWGLEKPATAHEIEAYASETSVDRGESIGIHVSSRSPAITWEVF